VARTAHERFYPKNSHIVRKDEAGTSLFLIRSGEVKVVLEEAAGGEIPLSILDKGSFFGEMSLFDGRPRSAIETNTFTHMYASRCKSALDVATAEVTKLFVESTVQKVSTNTPT